MGDAKHPLIAPDGSNAPADLVGKCLNSLLIISLGQRAAISVIDSVSLLVVEQKVDRFGKTPIEQLFISLVWQKPRVRFSKQLGQPESIDRRDQKIGSNSMVQIRRSSSEAIQITSYNQVLLCIEPGSERFDRLIPRRIIRCSNGLNPAIRN
jgi:hypothetical protein